MSPLFFAVIVIPELIYPKPAKTPKISSLHPIRLNTKRLQARSQPTPYVCMGRFWVLEIHWREDAV